MAFNGLLLYRGLLFLIIGSQEPEYDSGISYGQHPYKFHIT